jgi:mannose-6-phosphate isomerase-like protein (cupin superfamily)
MSDRKIVRQFNWLDRQPDKKKDATGRTTMDVRFLATKDSCGTEFLVFGRSICAPRAESESDKHELHTHANSEEVIHILRGTGRGLSGGQWFDLKPGDVLYAPKGEEHAIENASDLEPLEFVFCYAPAASVEESGYHAVDPELQAWFENVGGKKGAE